MPASSSGGNIPKALPNRSCPGADAASGQVGALHLESWRRKTQPCCAEALGQHGNVTKMSPRARKAPPSPVAFRPSLGWFTAVSHSTSRAQRFSPRGKTKRGTEILPLGSSAECLLGWVSWTLFFSGAAEPPPGGVCGRPSGSSCPSLPWQLQEQPHLAEPGVQAEPCFQRQLKKGEKKGKKPITCNWIQ